MNEIINNDCIEGMRDIADGSIDCILTDPPYLYLKNQKLDIPFDEQAFFEQCKRVLKKDGFIVLFGRGSSFYRWNTILADIGFNFKEEIVWDKSYCTSPLMALSRVHETVSIHTKGKGVINRVKVPYLEMKGHNIDGVIQDINRMKAILNNTKSLDAVLAYLDNNVRDTSDAWHSNDLSISSDITKEDRSVSCMRSIKQGLNEKTIVRLDITERLNHKHMVSSRIGMSDGDRSTNVLNSITKGMNEKTIIKQVRDHYKTQHPTQKPVRLLERLLALVTKPTDVVLDPFSGSGSTAVACINSDRQFIGYEIDKEYYDASVVRIKELQHDRIVSSLAAIDITM